MARIRVCARFWTGRYKPRKPGPQRLQVAACPQWTMLRRRTETPSAMLARLDRADAKFHGVLTEVRNRSAWDDTFVDALCEPPETFTFGGMFAHVITFNAHRRMLAMDALRGLGVKVEGFGCPTEYVASLTSA